jgi:hypothetical protein
MSAALSGRLHRNAGGIATRAESTGAQSQAI